MLVCVNTMTNFMPIRLVYLDWDWGRSPRKVVNVLLKLMLKSFPLSKLLLNFLLMHIVPGFTLDLEKQIMGKTEKSHEE